MRSFSSSFFVIMRVTLCTRHATNRSAFRQDTRACVQTLRARAHDVSDPLGGRMARYQHWSSPGRGGPRVRESATIWRGMMEETLQILVADDDEADRSAI